MFVLIGILVFVMFATIVIVLIGESRALRVRERVEALQQQKRIVLSGTPLADELSKSLFQRLVLPALGRLESRIMNLVPSRAIMAIRRKLDSAGSLPYLTAASFMTLKFFSSAGGLLGAAVIMVTMPWPLLSKAVAAIAVAAIGFLAPDYVVEGLIRGRQTRIRKSLPDIIDLLVVSAEAGTGLDGALVVVTKRKKGPMADEFNRVLTEMRLGKSRHEAWTDMAERVGLMELSMLVAALRQAEELGVSIANTLRTQADSLRTRRSARIRQLAATLSVKMLFPLIFCILPALFIVVLGPGLLSLGGLSDVFGR